MKEESILIHKLLLNMEYIRLISILAEEIMNVSRLDVPVQGARLVCQHARYELVSSLRVGANFDIQTVFHFTWANLRQSAMFLAVIVQ